MVVPEMEVFRFGAFSLTPTLEGNQSTRPEIGDPLAWPPHARRIVDLRLRAPCRGGPFTGSGQSMALRQLAALTRSLMSVVPVTQAYIVANYKETQLTDVRPGQRVEIEVDTFPGVAVRGHVDSIAPASGQEFALLPPDNATGNFTKVVQRIPVKIVLDPGSPLAGELRPGMSVYPAIDTKPRDQPVRVALAK
jgi:membrane fusion protein, multidrug efflux system